MRLLPTLLLTLLLSACGTDDANEPDEAPPEPAAAGQEAAPGESTEQRRERLRRAMREHRHESAAPDAAPRRQRPEPRLSDDWWNDAELAGHLQLAEHQVASLERAAETLHRSRLAARQEMIEARRQLSRGLADGENDRAGQATARRDRARRAVAEAEAAWLDELARILDEDQLERLAQHRPEALSAPARHERGPAEANDDS